MEFFDRSCLPSTNLVRRNGDGALPGLGAIVGTRLLNRDGNEDAIKKLLDESCMKSVSSSDATKEN